MALSFDHRFRQASGPQHRRGPARPLFPPRRKARFLALAPRPCGQRGASRGSAGADRLRPRTARYRAGAIGVRSMGPRVFTDQGVGLGAEATLWLTERGVEVVGTDAWSWDAPFSHTARRWAETRDPAIIWEGPQGWANPALLPPPPRSKSSRTSPRSHRTASW